MTKEIRVRWVIFFEGDKVGEGTTVATPSVLNRMVNAYAREGKQFLWERVTGPKGLPKISP